MKKFLLKQFKKIIPEILLSSLNKRNQDGLRCENLTSIPGIGLKNCRVFWDAGYTTPESIISAEDKDLLRIPGVGIGFIKKLRKSIGRI